MIALVALNGSEGSYICIKEMLRSSARQKPQYKIKTGG